MNIFTAILVCSAIVGQEPMSQSKRDTKTAACVDLMDKAHMIGLDPIEVASIGWVESRFNPNVVSKAGARGMLQAIPKYWCKGKRRGCDYTAAGLSAWTYYRHKTPLMEALCKYSSGMRCYKSKKARVYARKTMSIIRAAKSVIEMPRAIALGVSW